MCLIVTEKMLVNTKHVSWIEMDDSEKPGQSVMYAAFNSVSSDKKVYLTPIMEMDTGYIETALHTISKYWFNDKVIELKHVSAEDKKSDKDGDA